MLLTSRLIQDPPYFRRREVERNRISTMSGLGFVALGLGTLQIVLDKGQREDWFESHFITDSDARLCRIADLCDHLGVEA